MKKQFNAVELRKALNIKDSIYTAVKPSIELADNLSATIMEQLLTNGLSTREEATPYVVFYVAEISKKVQPYNGLRGWTFGRDAYAEDRRYRRILDKMFKDTVVPSAKPKTAKKADVVSQLVTKYSKLTKAEQRRFLASI
jgi:hypothetical protein